MAKGMMSEAGAAAGARGDLGDRARPRPEAAPTAYGGIEADRLVVLAKPLPSGAGYCTPFAVVRFEDLPEELRRQITGASGHGTGAGASAAALPRDPNAAPVAAPPRGEGDARYHYHAALPVDVVAEEGLRLQLPGVVSGPDDDLAVKFAGDGNRDSVNEYSERRILPLIDEDGKVVVHLDASRLQGLGDMEGSLFDKEKGFSQAWMGHSADEVCAAHGYMGAFYDNGLPARDYTTTLVALLLGNNHIAAPRALDCSDGLASPHEDAVPFVTKQGVYYDEVLPPPENVVCAAKALPVAPSPTYAVQVSVDAAAGGKAGDPTVTLFALTGRVAGVKAAGKDAGSLSAVLGIVVASSAATALATGTVGPATAFGLFAALVGGLSLAMASVRAR